MRFGRSPDGDFVIMADDIGAEVVTVLSRNAADALFDSLLRYRLEREPAGPPDEPQLITGEA